MKIGHLIQDPYLYFVLDWIFVFEMVFCDLALACLKLTVLLRLDSGLQSSSSLCLLSTEIIGTKDHTWSKILDLSSEDPRPRKATCLTVSGFNTLIKYSSYLVYKEKRFVLIQSLMVPPNFGPVANSTVRQVFVAEQTTYFLRQRTESKSERLSLTLSAKASPQ